MKWISFLSHMLVTLPLGGGGRGGGEAEPTPWELQATATAKKSAFEGLVGDGCGFWEIRVIYIIHV